MSAEDTFMQDLFAGLDDTAFDSPTLSSSPARSLPKRGVVVSRPTRALAEKKGNLLRAKAIQPAQVEAEKKTTTKAAIGPALVPIGNASPRPVVRPRITNKVSPNRPKADKGKEKAVEDDFANLFDGMEEWSDVELDDVVRKSTRVPYGENYLRLAVTDVYEEVHPETKRYCKVLRVALDGPSSSTSASNLDKIYLQDDWFETKVMPDDIINILGPVSPEASCPLLSYSNNTNLLILQPDTLLTATSIANAVPCPRRPLVQDRLRSSAKSNEAMLYGNLLHELFQLCLRKGEWSEQYRLQAIKQLCTRQAHLSTIWTLDLNLHTVVEQLQERSKTWPQWAKTYVSAQPLPGASLTDPRGPSSTSDATPTVCINTVLDIEEDIWSPRLGIKGKIDASLQVKIKSGKANAAKRLVAPFEIKTGRSTFVLEHRAQTMLYTMLMSERYDDDLLSGLLFYTQTGQVYSVDQARNEVRGLLHNRNELAAYTSMRSTYPHKPQRMYTSEDIEDLASPSQAHIASQADSQDIEDRAILPKPIDQPKTCKRCFAVDACMLYRATVEDIPVEEATNAQEMRDIIASKTEHISPQQARFFRHWELLVSMEEKDIAKYQREIWTALSHEMEEKGRCLADMTVDLSYNSKMDDALQSSNFPFIYRLVRAAHTASPLLHPGQIGLNDAVILSVQKPQIVALATGYVLELKQTHIVLGLTHALSNLHCLESRQIRSPVFRIDKNELSTGMGKLRDNVAQLLFAEGDTKRRALVVDLEEPRFSEMPSTLSPEELSLLLNEDQKNAIVFALNARDYALILGMPGTGKTTTTAELIQALVRRGKSVLLTSYTHSAVDNILLKLKGTGVDVLRLGNKDKIMPELHEMTFDESQPVQTIEELESRFLSPSVVATTALGIGHPLFTKRRFDYCIVDEASQIALPACLGPLRYAETFVLVGDHKQLPPLARSQAAKLAGYEESLFKRLCEAHPQAVASLTHQYRMNSEIMCLSNNLVYEGQLKCGSEEVANRRLEISVTASLDGSWLPKLFAGPSVVFCDTDSLDATETRKANMVTNQAEVQLVYDAVSGLVKSGLSPSDIAVISMYRQQIKLLTVALVDFKGIEILTADKAQGRDKECVLVSFVRSNEDKKVGQLIKDWRRLNVTLTRARSKLVMFGSRATLEPTLSGMFQIIDERGFNYQLPEGALGKRNAPRTPSQKRSQSAVACSPLQILSPSPKRNRL